MDFYQEAVAVVAATTIDFGTHYFGILAVVMAIP